MPEEAEEEFFFLDSSYRNSSKGKQHRKNGGSFDDSVSIAPSSTTYCTYVFMCIRGLDCTAARNKVGKLVKGNNIEQERGGGAERGERIMVPLGYYFLQS